MQVTQMSVESLKWTFIAAVQYYGFQISVDGTIVINQGQSRWIWIKRNWGKYKV